MLDLDPTNWLNPINMLTNPLNPYNPIWDDNTHTLSVNTPPLEAVPQDISGWAVVGICILLVCVFGLIAMIWND